jgi:hypothetical protein
MDRSDPEYLKSLADIDGLRAAGFEKLRPGEQDPVGSRKVTQEANRILGF